MTLRDKLIDDAEAPKDAIALALREYTALCESFDATEEKIREAHLRFFRSVDAWTRLTEPVTLPLDGSAIAAMDIRYREDARGVESITITAASLDQVEALTRFLHTLADAKRAAKDKIIARPSGLLEIQ